VKSKNMRGREKKEEGGWSVPRKKTSNCRRSRSGRRKGWGSWGEGLKVEEKGRKRMYYFFVAIREVQEEI